MAHYTRLEGHIYPSIAPTPVTIYFGNLINPSTFWEEFKSFPFEFLKRFLLHIQLIGIKFLKDEDNKLVFPPKGTGNSFIYTRLNTVWGLDNGYYFNCNLSNLTYGDEDEIQLITNWIETVFKINPNTLLSGYIKVSDENSETIFNIEFSEIKEIKESMTTLTLD